MLKKICSLSAILFSFLLILSCSKIKEDTTPKVLPTVLTGEPSVIDSNSATLNAQVLSNGNDSLLDRGVVLKTTAEPTINDLKFSSGKIEGAFTSLAIGLESGTTYYYRGYAMNSKGTSYGMEKSFTTSASTPKITTAEITSISYNTSISGGNITHNGGSVILERGVCWSVNKNPTTSDFKIISGSGAGSFICNLKSLKNSTTYYVRAYAINAKGTSYGKEVTFKTLDMQDIDGNKYAVVTIGNQIWMGENLRVSKYRNGDVIPEVKNPATWVSLSGGAFTYYNNDSLNNIPYGKLYNWYTVVDARELCPTGWHVPTDNEWTILSDFLGGAAVAGGKLKQTGNTTWAAPNVATNEYDYNAVPNGCRCNPQGDYGGGPQAPNPRIGAVFWTRTEQDQQLSWLRGIPNNTATLDRGLNYKYYGFGVRCVKD